MKKWGEYSYDVQFILQRSPLDPLKGVGTEPKGPPSQGIWKTPPGRLKPDTARLSPDSGNTIISGYKLLKIKIKFFLYKSLK